jgi:hypothetical protein
MALPFFSTNGWLMPMLPDGGIYDPESGLSYIGFSDMQLGPGVNAPPIAAEFMKSTPGVTIDGYSTDSPSVTPTIVPTPTIKPPNITPPTITPTVTSTPAVTSVITPVLLVLLQLISVMLVSF